MTKQELVVFIDKFYDNKEAPGMPEVVRYVQGLDEKKSYVLVAAESF